LRGVVREHFPAAERVVVAGFAVDLHAHVQLFAVFLAGSRSERCFERFENHLFIDAFLVRDGIDDHQDFLVHRFLPPPGAALSGASLAFSISSNRSVTGCRSTSSSTPTSSIDFRTPVYRLRPSRGTLSS